MIAVRAVIQRAWGVVAGVAGTGGVAVWIAAATPSLKFPIWPAYGFGALAVIAFYMCFATLKGWWPGAQMRPQEPLSVSALETKQAAPRQSLSVGPVTAIPQLFTRATLMGDADQQMGDEVLRRVDDVLDDAAVTPSQLRQDLTGASPYPLQADPVQAPRRVPARRITGRSIPRRRVMEIAMIGLVAATNTSSDAPGVAAPAWTRTIGGTVDSSPGVVGGVVYVGTDDGTVYALDANTGAVRWSYLTLGAVESSPAVVGGVVYVGSDDGTVYALDANTGKVRWSLPIREITTSVTTSASTPAVVGGVVYVGSWDGNVYAVNAVTGAVRWKYPTGGAVESSPAVVGGVVYIVSDYADPPVMPAGSATTLVADVPGPLLTA